jgi:glycine cleavage system aminomethyltransferase T
MAVGQVSYTNWCDGEGKVIDDGTVSRLGPELYRWTAAEPNLRWIRQNAHGLEVLVEDVSDKLAALALQGPTSREILKSCCDGDVAGPQVLPRDARDAARHPVEISRTGYTGDLGYEIWVASEQALPVWDALMEAGRAYDITPTGMLALDVARIEAGLILLDVDYTSAKKALIPSQKYSPWEIGLGGSSASRRRRSSAWPRFATRSSAARRRELVGLDISWDDVERLHDEAGLAPQIPLTAVARLGAGLPRRRPGRPRLEHHLVAHAQEDDRARHDRSRRRAAGDVAADGDDRRPQAPGRRRDGCEASVFRPPPQARLRRQRVRYEVRSPSETLTPGAARQRNPSTINTL